MISGTTGTTRNCPSLPLGLGEHVNQSLLAALQSSTALRQAGPGPSPACSSEDSAGADRLSSSSAAIRRRAHPGLPVLDPHRGDPGRMWKSRLKDPSTRRRITGCITPPIRANLRFELCPATADYLGTGCSAGFVPETLTRGHAALRHRQDMSALQSAQALRFTKGSTCFRVRSKPGPDESRKRLAYLFAPPGLEPYGSRKGSEELKADYVAQHPRGGRNARPARHPARASGDASPAVAAE